MRCSMSATTRDPCQESRKSGPNGQLPCKITRRGAWCGYISQTILAGHSGMSDVPVASYMQRGGHLRCQVTSARGPARARPLTSASARQRPTCPGLPRNAIFLSCPCGCRACRRPGGLVRRLRPAAVSDLAVPASAVPAGGRPRVPGRHAVTAPASRPDAATRPAGAAPAAAGDPWGGPGGRAALRRSPGARRAAFPAAQACVRASRWSADEGEDQLVRAA